MMLFWYGIISAFKKGVAAQKSQQRKQQPLKRPVDFQCLLGILRAGRGKAAYGRCIGRNFFLIEIDKADKKFFHFSFCWGSDLLSSAGNGCP